MRELTGGRGPDAVGMEAHGAPAAKVAQQLTSLIPDFAAAPLMRRAGVDRLSALHLAIELVRRGGTISIVGVYGGMTDPMPMLVMFDKQIQLRMGQANVWRWVDEITPSRSSCALDTPDATLDLLSGQPQSARPG